MIEKTKLIWQDGKLVPWDDAKVHVATWSLHYGLAIFEGMRAYEGKNNTFIFRLEDHMKRMIRSAKMYLMPIPLSLEEMCSAVKKTVKANKIKSGYIRPVLHYGYMKKLGLNPGDTPINFFVFVVPFGRYLGEEALEKGIHCCISSWRRHAPFIVPPESKCCANYANSVLAKREALLNGYQEAILLDYRGFVSEGSGENIFIVRDSVLKTPPLHASILEGITRDSIMKISRDLGMKCIEQDITRGELYVSEEIFLTGTAGEVTPVTKIDHRVIGSGKVGPITKKLQKTYFDVVKGKNKKYKKWLTAVY